MPTSQVNVPPIPIGIMDYSPAPPSTTLGEALKQAEPKVGNRPSDDVIATSEYGKDDYNDFQARYLMPDSDRVVGDQPNIGYLRIVMAAKPTEVVFPAPNTIMGLKGGITGVYPGVVGNRFKQFILTHISDSFQERVQVTETSAKPVINFFGSRMQVLPIIGMLKNSAENPWTTNMVYLWEKYMSGSVLAEKGWIAEFYCNHVLYRGYPINFNMSISADRGVLAQFDMQLAVWERTPEMVSGLSYTPLSIPAHTTWPPNLPNVDATDPDMSPRLNWPPTPPNP